MTFSLYIDAGSGSLLVQMLVGALLGMGITVKLYWHRILARLRPDKQG